MAGGGAERSVEGCSEKMFGVLDCGGLRGDDDESTLRVEKGVEDVETASAAQVEDDIVHIQPTNVPEQLLLLAVLRVRDFKRGIAAAD